MAQARSTRAINRREKTRIRNLQYGPRNKVSKIFIISPRLIRRAEKEIFKVSGLYFTLLYGSVSQGLETTKFTNLIG